MQPLDTSLARRVLETMPAVLYIYDVVAEKSLYQNRRLGDLLGYQERVEAGGRTEWQLLAHSDDAKGFPAYRQQLKAIRPDQTLSWQYRMRASDGSWHWFQSHDVLLDADQNGMPLLVVGTAFDITDQKRAEERQRLLSQELLHRSRNFATLVQAIAHQTRPPAGSEGAEHFEKFAARLTALLSAGAIVLASEPRTVQLRELLDTTLAPFVKAGRSDRIVLDGSLVVVNEQTAFALGLAIHELATNAVKYGALSLPAGRVALSWQTSLLATRNGAELTWRESAGPPVTPPQRKSFGTSVIRRGAPDGRVTLDFRADGVHCHFQFPVVDA